MNLKKILGDRDHYDIPVQDMISLLKNEVRYSTCPLNEQIYNYALNNSSFNNPNNSIVIKESGIFFDIGIFSISLGVGKNICNSIDELIMYYKETMSQKYRNSDSFDKYIFYRINIIKEIKKKIELMYKNGNRVEKIDEDKIDENKLKLYVAYNDMIACKTSDYNSNTFLKSIKELNNFIKNNPKLIYSKYKFNYFDSKTYSMIECDSTEIVKYVKECVSRNNGKEFTIGDIEKKQRLYEAYLIMEDLKKIDKSVDYYDDYVYILNEYINDSDPEFSYEIIDYKTGDKKEYKVSVIKEFVKKINNTSKKLVYIE